MVTDPEYPLPDDPALAAVAAAMDTAGHWAWVVDDRSCAASSKPNRPVNFSASARVLKKTLLIAMYGSEACGLPTFHVGE